MSIKEDYTWRYNKNYTIVTKTNGSRRPLKMLLHSKLQKKNYTSFLLTEMVLLRSILHTRSHGCYLTTDTMPSQKMEIPIGLVAIQMD